ncbi:MAG: hypothetical protein ACTMIR_11585 [Cellulomonadaceae bacterium]
MRKNEGVFQTLVSRLSRSSGVGGAGQGGDALVRHHLGEQAVLGTVDQVVLLLLLDRLDRQSQLLGDLVVR